MIYTIVAGEDRLTVFYEVNKLNKQGWVPQGGIAIGPDGKLYQAMTHDNNGKK